MSEHRDSLSSNLLLEHKIKNAVDSCYDQVNRIAYPLFKSTPLSYFCYERCYDSGEMMYLGTGPDLAVKIIVDDLFPTLGELNLFNTFGMRSTFLSHHMPLPPGASDISPERYQKLICYAADCNLYHCLFIIDRMKDHYRICGFGVSGNLHAVFNFYLNIMSVLDNFITYFEYHADSLIETSCEDGMIELPHYHNKVTLIDPDIKLPVDFTSLDFLMNPPANYLDYKQCFTLREQECLALIAQGYTMKSTAKKLNISPRTVEQHLRNIKEKYGINTKNQLVDLWHSVKVKGKAPANNTQIDTIKI